MFGVLPAGLAEHTDFAKAKSSVLHRYKTGSRYRPKLTL